MPVVQEAFDIPVDSMTGLLTGEYRRFGGIVRYAVGPNKGQIVKHLKPVDVKDADTAKNMLAKGIEITKANPRAALAIGAGTLLATGGVFVYRTLKRREPVVLREFRNTLKEYLEAIRNGSMDMDVINKMSGSLQELKQHKDYEKFSIQLTAEDIEILVNKIHDYTIKLATDNDMSIEGINVNKTDDAIINLENYLNIQKKVFEEVA